MATVSVFAAYPLYATTLGTNWELALPESVARTKALKIGINWLAVLPGIVGAAVMSDASLIISIGGLFGCVYAVASSDALECAVWGAGL